jgi:hypothetical protein
MHAPISIEWLILLNALEIFDEVKGQGEGIFAAGAAAATAAGTAEAFAKTSWERAMGSSKSDSVAIWWRQQWRRQRSQQWQWRQCGGGGGSGGEVAARAAPAGPSNAFARTERGEGDWPK